MRFLTVFFLFISFTFTAQETEPDWTALMQDPNTNFFELQEQFNEFWAGKEHEKGDGYKPFKRWEYWAEKRLNVDGTLRSPSDHQRLFEEVKEYEANRSLEGNWEQLGPILAGATTRDDIPGIGRINAIEFHPTDPLTVYVGAPAGGLWKTTDGGAWWVSLTDDLPTLGVSAIIVDPTNPDIIYIGTGDRDSADAPGLGVWKSTDGGETWQEPGTGMPNVVVGMMTINPEDTEMVFAATNEGVYRTTNGGNIWTLVSPDNNFKDIKYHPTNTDILYATGSTAVYRSTNGGSTFASIGGTVSFSARSVIAVTPAEPDWVYICGAFFSDFRGLFKSEDAGETWEEMSDSPNILGWSDDADGGQAWYDLTIAANPENPLEILVGGVRVSRSLDGGVTWQEATNNFVHVDHHASAFSPHTNNYWLGNDGGIYELEDNTVWKDKTNGIVVSQMYKLGQSPHDVNNVLTGFQDNGTSEWIGTKWERRVGADGMECMYDHQDPDYFYGAIQNGQIRRTGPNYTAERCADAGFNGITENGLWVTPYALDLENTNTMYLGYVNLWRCNNIKTPNQEDIEWEQISDNLINNDGANINTFCQSDADPSIMYISKQTRKLFRKDDINDPESEWINLSNDLPPYNLTIDDVEAHPTDPDVIYMAFFHEVYKSSDRGENWEQLTGDDFPDVVINNIEYDKNSDEGLYIGTELGVFFKDATMEEWIPFSGGNLPPAVNVTELEIYYGEDISDTRLRAATYGRGLWESDLYDSETYYFPAKADILPANEESEIYGTTELEVKFYKNLNYVSAETLEINEIEATNATVTDISGGPIDYVITIEPTAFGEVTLFIPDAVATDDLGVETEASEILSLAYSPLPDPLGIYGPGGVGDDSNISYWFMSDENLLDAEGGSLPADGETVGYWADVRSTGPIATQENTDEQPIYVASTPLFNGKPAIQFIGENDYLRTNEVAVKENITSFLVASAQNNPDSYTLWNEYGWLASAREANGFIVHPWKDAFHTTGIIYDNENNETNGLNTIFVPGINTATIHGMEYYNNGANKFLDSYVNGNVDRRQTNEVVRDADDLVQVNFGRDFGDRYGAGMMSEQVLYTERLYPTHTLLVRNYLSSKYGAPCDGLDRYFQDELYGEHVTGIGMLADHDKHLDAQGRGIVRMNGATDMDAGEFLLWGTNQAAMEWGWGSDVFLTGRVSRTWGYQETGDLGEVTVQIYDEDGALDVDFEIGLIVLENPTFVQGMTPEYYPLSNVDGVWTTTVDFSGTGVFTIGYQPIVKVDELEAELVVYPNPASDVLFIDLSAVPAKEAVLLDAMGREVKVISTLTNPAEVSVSDLAIGNYILQVTTTSGEVLVEKVSIGKE